MADDVLFSLNDQEPITTTRIDLFSQQAEPGSFAEIRQSMFNRMFPDIQEQPTKQDYIDRRVSLVNYADPPKPNPIPYLHSSDVYTLDPDPFGEKVVRYGKRIGESYDSNFVPGLTVFGRPMSRDTLLSSDAGTKLLKLEEKKRLGLKRGFKDAITDFQWSDIPFLSLFATVGGSISDAVTVSDTMKKLQNHEFVSDDELIKTRLYLAEQEYNSNGTWGSTVGDIVRAAPGFMIEFVLSGSLFSAARTAVVSGAKRGIHLGITRASKIAAREAVDTSVDTVLKTSGKGIISSVSDLALGKNEGFKQSVIKETTDKIMSTMWDDAAKSVVSPMYKGMTKESLQDLAEKRAAYEFEKMMARRGSSSAITNGIHSFGQWLGSSTTRGLIDFGSWGTEESTILFRKSTTAGKYLTEAVSSLVEAPIKGSLLMAPNYFVSRPLLGSVLGKDGQTVSSAQLSLQESALRQGNKQLMDSAESIAFGMNLLEYVSENAGRGLKSLGQAAGIGLGKLFNKTGVSATVKAAAEHVGLIGDVDKVKFGGRIRQWIDDVFGTRESFIRKMSADKLNVVVGALEKRGLKGVDRASLGQALQTGIVDGLSSDVRDVVGSDINAFAKSALDAAYKTDRRGLEYKSYLRYTLADFMTRNNIGPQSIMNLYDKMGYDGILGEMLEERYSDVAKGLLGLNDKEYKSFMDNISEAAKGLYPGFDQLTAEAVGFAVPMVTRAGVMKAMSAIGGEGPYTELKNVLDNFYILTTTPRAVQIRFGTLKKAYSNLQKEYDDELSAENSKLEKAKAAGNEEWVSGITENIKNIETKKNNLKASFETSMSSVEEMAKSNAEKIKVKWDGMSDEQVVTVRPISEREASDANGLFNFTISDATGADQAVTSVESIILYAPKMARMMYEAASREEGEDRTIFRTIARKAIGFAGALTTGDFSLMADNPVQWTARDAGFSDAFCKSLTSGFKTTLDEVKRTERSRRIVEAYDASRGEFSLSEDEQKEYDRYKELSDKLDPAFPDKLSDAEANELSELEAKFKTRLSTEEMLKRGRTFSGGATNEELLNRAQELFAKKAQNFMESYINVHRCRSFSTRQMTDQAVYALATKKYGFTDVTEDGRVVKYDTTGPDLTVKESVSVDDFVKEHKKEVEDTRARIELATLDLLTKRSVQSTDDRMGLLNAVRLPAFDKSSEADAIEDKIIYDAALRMSGFTNFIVRQTLDAEKPTKEQMRENSVGGGLSMDVVGYVAKKAKELNPTDPTRASVDSRALESIANSMNLRFDGTDQSLEDRNRYIIKLCLQANELDDPDIRVFVATDSSKVDPRISNGSTFVYVKKNKATGNWEFTKNEDSPGDRIVADTEANLVSQMRDLGFEKTTAKVVFTQAKTYVSHDAVTMMRHVGVLPSYAKMMEKAYNSSPMAESADPTAVERDQSKVHPMFRKNENGSWMYTEEEAEDQLAVEMASASKDGTSGTAQANKIYDNLYGEDGYLTKADKLLSKTNVETSDVLDMFTGRDSAFAPSKQYVVSAAIMMDNAKTGDIYVPIDFHIAQDYTRAMLSAKLVQAYRRYPKFLREAVNKDLGEFIYQLDALIDLKIEQLSKETAGSELTKEDRDELISGLRAFQTRSTRAADKIVVQKDGTTRVIRGAGVTPGSFVDIMSTFACFQDKRLGEAGLQLTPNSRALAYVADDARRLPAYTGLVSICDTVLGGNGYLNEKISRTINGKEVDMFGKTGLSRILSVFSAGTKDFAKSLSASLPGGMDYDTLLSQCDSWMFQKNKTNFSEATKEDLRKYATGASNGNTEDHYKFISKLISELGVKDGEVGRVFTDIVSAANIVTNGEMKNFVESAKKTVQKAKDYATAEEKYLEASSALRTAIKTREELEARVKTLEEKLAAADAALSNTKTSTDENVASELATAREDVSKITEEIVSLRSSAAERRDALTRSDVGGGTTIKVNEDYAGAESDFITVITPEDEVEDDDLLTVEADDGTSDRLSVFDSGDALPEVSGIRRIIETSLFGMTDKDARLVVNISVRALLAQGFTPSISNLSALIDDMYDKRVSEDDKLFMLNQFNAAEASMLANGKTWNDIQNGRDWDFGNDEKDDEGETSNDAAFNKTAVSEFNNRELKSFLSAVQLMMPEAGRNFLAISTSIRDSVNALYENLRSEETKAYFEGKYFVDNPEKKQAILDASEFMYKLMNPRIIDGATFNERDAAYMKVLEEIDDTAKIRGYINTLMNGAVNSRTGKRMDALSKRSAFLLSYMSSIPKNVRVRFTQLIANSSECTPVKYTVNKFTGEVSPVVNGTRTDLALTEETVVGSFTKFIGNTPKEVKTVIESFRAAKEEVLSGRVPGLLPITQKMSVIEKVNAARRNGIIYAKVISRALGRENPICSALLSNSFYRYFLDTSKFRGDNNTAVKQVMSMLSAPTSVKSSYGRYVEASGNINILEYIDSIITVISETKTKKLTRDDISKAANLILQTGLHDLGKLSLGPINPEASSPLATMLSFHADSMPDTITSAIMDPSRDRGKSSSIALASRGVVPILSQWMDSKSGFQALCEKFFPESAADKRIMDECRQNMTWPDPRRTPILAKNLSKSYSMTELVDACAKNYKLSTAVYYFPIFSGEHSSQVMMQIPTTVKFSDSADYDVVANAIGRNIGLDKFGNDPKRSAVTCLEATGMGLWGTRADGTKGTNYVAVAYNLSSRKNKKEKGNENDNSEFLGSTTIRGYGADRIRLGQQNPDTSVEKVHLISTGGDLITFLKSLSVSTTEEGGRPLEGSALRAHEDFIDKFLGKDKDISTVIMTDLDSYKVGPALSKTIRVYDSTGKDLGSIGSYIFDKLADMNGGEGKELTTDEVKTLLDGLVIKDSSRGNKDLGPIDNVLPGVQLRSVDGLNGKTYALVYESPDITAYTVANVSHSSSFPRGDKFVKTPRNYIVDMLAMATTLDSLGNIPGISNEAKRFVANYGALATSVTLNDKTIADTYLKSLMRLDDSADIAALRAAGEDVSGQNIVESLAKKVWAKMRNDLNVPLHAINMPLVAAGACVNRDRTTFHQCLSEMQKDMQKGSVIFSEEQSKIYKTRRRLALCNINMNLDNGTFRYGWFLNEGAFRKAYENLRKEGQELPTVQTLNTESDIVDALEKLFTYLRTSQEELLSMKGKSDKKDDKIKSVAAVRKLLADVFVDHHNTQISKYGEKYYENVNFEDLFMRTGDSKQRVFDRSAIQYNDGTEDAKVYNDATGERHIFLGGTMFGLPRTPSYNGSMWLQTVRAGLPVTEIETADASGKTTYRVGRDAMVSPDPITNSILGCDHDGDKAAVYLFSTRRAGLVDFFEIPDKGSMDEEKYLEYLGNMKDSSGRPVVQIDKTSGGYKITEKTKAGINNSFTRMLFDMARELPVDPGRTSPRPFVGLELSEDKDGITKTSPISGDAIKRIINEAAIKYRGAAPILDSTHRIVDIRTAARVADSASNADKSRGIMVNLAMSLHMMWSYGSNKMKKKFFGEDTTATDWLKFIYRIDGLSNATFDDIKEQKCSRLGWVSNMMNSLIATVLSDKKIPTTDAEFEKLLSDYLESYYGGGAMSYVARATNKADFEFRSMISTIIGGRKRADLTKFLGLPYVKGDGDARKLLQKGPVKEVLLVDADGKNAINAVSHSSGAFIKLGAYFVAPELGKTNKAITHVLRSSPTSELTGYCVYLHNKYKTLTNKDKSFSGLLSDLARGIDTSVTREFKKDIDTMYGYLSGLCKVSGMRNLSKIVNYVKIDPLDDSTSDTSLNNTQDDLNKWAYGLFGKSYTKVLRGEEEDLDFELWDSNVWDMLSISHRLAANGKLSTVKKRGLTIANRLYRAKDTEDTEDADESSEQNEALIATLNPIYKILEIESAGQQVPYVFGALTHFGGMEFYDKIRRAATGVANETPGDKEVAGKNGKGVIGNTFEFRRGVEACFNLMCRLANSSTEALDNPIFSFFRMANDSPSFSREGYGDTAAGLKRIIARLAGASGSTQEFIRNLYSSVMDGASFSGERYSRFELKDGRHQLKTCGFTLTEDMLKPIKVKENVNGEEETSLKYGSLLIKEDPGMIGLQQILRDAYGFIKGLGEPVTPSLMFSKLLPLYAVSTSRTLGAPVPGSTSLLSLMPTSLYNELSKWQAKLTNSGILAKELVNNYAMEKKRGSVFSQQTVRENPPYRNTMDIFPTGPCERMIADTLKDIERESTSTQRSENTVGADVARIMNGEVPASGAAKLEDSPKTRSIAARLGALVASWATVEYHGGTSFILKGGLRGSSGESKQIRILVDVSPNGFVETEDQLRARANSTAFAASLCGSVDIGMTPQMFMSLPESTKIAYARKFSVGGATSNKVVWTVDRRGAETLVGNIRLDGTKDANNVYHEYFHAMMGMFRSIGLFGVEDIKAMRSVFGEAPKGQDVLFDEEKAADAFKKYVLRKADPSAEVKGVFQKIYNFLKGFIEALKAGFAFTDDRTHTENILFNMMIHGIAEKSSYAKDGITFSTENGITKISASKTWAERNYADTSSKAVALEIADKLSKDFEKKSLLDLTTRKQIETEDGEKVKVVKASTEAMDDAARQYFDIGMENMYSATVPNVNVLDTITDPDVKAVVSEKLYAVEKLLSEDSPSDLERIVNASKEAASSLFGVDLADATVTEDTPYLTVSPLGTDAYESELIRAAARAGATFSGVDRNLFYKVAEAATESMIHGLKSEGSWSTTLAYAVKKYKSSGVKSGIEDLRDRAVVRDALRQTLRMVNPKSADKILANKELEKSLTFEAMLCMYQHLQSSFIQNGNVSDKNYTWKMPEGYEDASELKDHASLYDVSAWCMAGYSMPLGDITGSAVTKLEDLLSKTPADSKEHTIIRTYLSHMRELHDHVSDVTETTKFVTGSIEEEINGIVSKMVSGLNKPTMDDSGNLGDYTTITDPKKTKNEWSRKNVEMLNPLIGEGADKGAPGYWLVQETLKTAIPTMFTVMAGAKFYRELGVVPSGAEDIAAAKRLMTSARKSPMTEEEWLDSNAIGPSNLIDNENLIDYYDQSFFIANDTGSWLSSMVRKSFGGQNLRDIILAYSHDFEGLKAKQARVENWHAFKFGTNCEVGGRLLAIENLSDNFSVKDGEIIYNKEGKKTVKGVDNYHRKYTSETMEKEDLEIVDFFMKALKVFVQGGNSIITGLDKLTFSSEDIGDVSYYKIENIIKRRDNGEKRTKFEEALYRLSLLPKFIVSSENGGLGLYDRVVEAAVSAINSVKDNPESIAPGVTESKTINERVSLALERLGLVNCKRDENTGDIVQSVITISSDEINDYFKRSDTFKKLERAGRNYMVKTSDGVTRHCLDREVYAEETMSVYRDAMRFVKQHPWITEGDAKYLNSFSTPLPFFSGSGIFGYEAVSFSRDKAESALTSLYKLEQSFYNSLYTKGAKDPINTQSMDTIVGYLEQVKDLYGVTDDVTKFYDDVVNGKYETPNKYGFIIKRDDERAVLSTLIYKKLQEAKLGTVHGIEEKGYTNGTIERLLDIYESSYMSKGRLVHGALGMTDGAVFRKFGVKPKNYQLDHAVRIALDQITNAVMQRCTIANMILTPAADGAPVYYVRPSDLNETIGLPDKFWEIVARWWSSFHRGSGVLAYNEATSGKENARRIYDELSKINGGVLEVKDNGKLLSRHKYVALPPDDNGLKSVNGWLVMEDEDLGDNSSALNTLGGGEAMGYLKQVVKTGNTLGLGGSAFRSCMHRALSWSKSMSVSFSFFFPLATRWESPIGAVGSMATIAGNLGLSDAVRNNPDVFNAMQAIFPGSGWATKNFLGMDDVLKMMDTNSTFMSEMVSWAHALGITLSTNLSNPVENSRSIVVEDIKKLKRIIKREFGDKLANRYSKLTELLVTRSGEKSFNYVLNATKLAVVSQLAMKLRYEAKKRGRAFDPIRDLRKYSSYINAEIGGIDPKKYAWSHPTFRGIMNCLMFSWEWTRGAWEAGGGGIIEDYLFGGHNFTKSEREIMLGRWTRMYGEVMIGVPLLMQLVVKGLSTLIDSVAGGGDDDDKSKENDRWFTWQNEDKTKWCAFDLTPLMRSMSKIKAFRSFRENETVKNVLGFGGGILGAGAGGLLGLAGGKTGVAVGGALGGALGYKAASALPKAIPMYTGNDPANRTTKQRRYYMHFGKQGWEFFRWFDAPGQQFFSKLSMPTQRIMESFIGRNMSYLDKSLPWEDMGALERWLDPSVDGALFNVAKAFLPFSVNGLNTFSDAGLLPIFGPVQMGASQTNIQDRLVKRIEQWANNDRRGYQFGIRQLRQKKPGLEGMVIDILHDAKVNGLDPAEQLKTAIGQVMTKTYGKLINEFPDNPGDDFDVKAVEKYARSLNRLGAKKANILSSLKKRLTKQGKPWNKSMSDDQKRMYHELIGRTILRPFDLGVTPTMFAPAVEQTGNGVKFDY